MSISDEEFRQKLQGHFSLYRVNLRAPIASQIAIDHWYRIDLLLVNELGLFKRADIEPDGKVIMTVELWTPQDITPLTPSQDYQVEVRSCSSFAEGRLQQPQTIPGFEHAGKGCLEYRVRPKQSNHTPSALVYLLIKPTQLIRFPKQQQKNLDFILPLVIGPIHIAPDYKPTVDTSLPLELWQPDTLVDMVYDGYRLFSTTSNVAIHEMWDTGIPGKIWDSALVMLDVIKNMTELHPDYLNHKRILDLSAGTGLLGLYIASMMMDKVGKGQIIITELNEAVDLINQNIHINKYLKSRISLETKSLLWGDTKQAEACGKVDLIIASDVLYESQFFEDLVKSFVDLSHKATRIYIGYKRRGFDEQEERRFWSLCEQHFNVTLLTFEGQNDLDDHLVPKITLETGVQIYRLVPL